MPFVPRPHSGQSHVVGGQDMAPFLSKEADLFPEGLSLLGLCVHNLLKPWNLLVCNSPLILELSSLKAYKQILCLLEGSDPIWQIYKQISV